MMIMIKFYVNSVLHLFDPYQATLVIYLTHHANAFMTSRMHTKLELVIFVLEASARLHSINSPCHVESHRKLDHFSGFSIHKSITVHLLLILTKLSIGFLAAKICLTNYLFIYLFNACFKKILTLIWYSFP